MKHYYLYIEAGAQLTPDSHFYKVAIGQSAKELRKRAWLESYAIEHGHLFQVWLQDAADFYAKCVESLAPSPAPLQVMDASALIRKLKTGEDDPDTFFANLNRHRLLMKIDSRYYSERVLIRMQRG